ncbi:hypothetical protein NQ318_016625 [Aromia moschata]|uniref:DUF4817 domain-containing protein n=1 Tax=Aromia moschata TaxID=1265417 RepID=A0AAV8X9F7_9CUCU|nr:hypothetical protein NQ318_016625 [Aromia moschata]
MIGYGDRARTQCEVVRLFRETHPDLPPLNQGTISKIEAQYREMGHVRKVPSKRQAVVDDDTKLNLLLALEENPITPARQLARDIILLHILYNEAYAYVLRPMWLVSFAMLIYPEFYDNKNDEFLFQGYTCSTYLFLAIQYPEILKTSHHRATIGGTDTNAIPGDHEITTQALAEAQKKISISNFGNNGIGMNDA